MPLSVPTIRNAKPSEKRYKLHDTGGLYLLVVPTGGRLWRFDYRFEGRRKTISMGGFPEIGLADARRRRDEARKQLADGIDPSEPRKAQKSSRPERACDHAAVRRTSGQNLYRQIYPASAASSNT